MITPELLAPAGNEKCAYAAVQSGADSIYIGMKNFGARSYAENFDNESFARVVNYCHQRGVKVYVTLNTLIADIEMNEAVECARVAASIGVDGVIVQDLGLLSYIKEFFPEINLHISTQATVLNSYAMEFARELGAVRCVLGRELSYEEIKSISEKASIETEIFVHGAQCYSYSGQCLMSSMYGGRSGNKGKCAGPCRMPYKLQDKNGKIIDAGYLLSPVDMCLGTQIEKVIDSGAKCLKIEGRMKGPEYVAASCEIYKKALTQRENIPDDELTSLQNTFSRGGFTSGLFEGKDNRIKKESSNEDAYKNQESKYKNIYKENLRRNPIKLKFYAKPGEKAVLFGEALGVKVECESNISVEIAKGAPLTQERILQQLEKLGDYPLYAIDTEVSIEGEIFLPVSEINLLRRTLCDTLFENIKNEFKYNKHIIKKPVPVSKKEKFITASVKTKEQAESIKNYSEIKEIYVPFNLYDMWEDERFIPYFPAIIREKHLKKYENVLKTFKEKGVKKVKVSEWGTFYIAKKLGFNIIAGDELNVFNTKSAYVLKEMGAEKIILSPEMNVKQLEFMGEDISYEVIVYGRLTLMKTANCPLKNKKLCGKNSNEYNLIDRKGEKIPVVCSCDDCVSYFYNSTPLYMADKKSEIPSNISGLQLYFTVETPDECEQELQNLLKGTPPQNKFTRGHFFRGVL